MFQCHSTNLHAFAGECQRGRLNKQAWTAAEEEICGSRATQTKWQAIINTGRVLSELLPVGSKELWSAHHMHDEEGGKKKQRLVHRLPLSHVPSLVLSHSSLCQRRMKGRGLGGIVARSQSPPHAECVCFSSRRMTPATCNREEI